MKKREPSDLVEREFLVQERDGVSHRARPRAGSSVMSAATASASQELALKGDCSPLAQRVRDGVASREELNLAAGLLTGQITPQRKKLPDLFVEDRRQLVAQFIQKGERDNPGVKRESLIEEAMTRFKVKRSEVFTSLGLYESK
jgi:hypothetical protein